MTETWDLKNTQWGLSKMELRAMVEAHDEHHIFIEPGYFEWRDNTTPPRVKVAKTWVKQMLSRKTGMPDQFTPGVLTYEHKGKKCLLLVPYTWEPN